MAVYRKLGVYCIILLFVLPFMVHSLLHAHLRLSHLELSPTKNVSCGSYYIKSQSPMRYWPHTMHIILGVSCPNSMSAGPNIGVANATITFGGFDSPINVALVTCGEQRPPSAANTVFVGCFDASHMVDGMPVYVSSFSILAWIMYHSFTPIHIVIYTFVTILMVGSLLSTRV